MYLYAVLVRYAISPVEKTRLKEDIIRLFWRGVIVSIAVVPRYPMNFRPTWHDPESEEEGC